MYLEKEKDSGVTASKAHRVWNTEFGLSVDLPSIYP
jgi:hypothetical protein